MTKSLQYAIEKLKELPEERQDELAEGLMAVVEGDLHRYDDDDLRQSLQEQLAMTHEFEVLTAETAAKGIGVLENEHLDLVVLDVAYHLTDEQLAEVRGGRANPDRKFVSLAEARKRLRHHDV